LSLYKKFKKNILMNKFFHYTLIISITAILTFSYSVQATKNHNKTKTQSDYYKLFHQIINITEKNYVEDIETDQLFYSAFNGMLRSLDPHSAFLDPDDYAEMNVQTSGEFGGVGIEITSDRGLIKIISPLDDTPAQKAGIMPLDYITMIDSKPVQNLTINQAVQKIRGPRGSEVTLTIIRKDTPKPLNFTLKRAVIKLVSVKSKILQDNVAYFRITSFTENTTDSFENKFLEIKKELGDKLSGIVLDLRNNPGGLLNQAIGISELFLDGGVVVSTKGRNRHATEVFNAALGDIAKDIPIITIINQGSASASEIVAGALQDHKRSIIIGTKSFGKGSVQTVVPLGKKLGMRLTTSRYYTPLGKSIQASGIKPDIYITQKKVAEDDNRSSISEEDLPGHLSQSDQEQDSKADHKADLLTLYQEDYQLARAIDLIKALLVVKK
jgi:carboxyl-terminal processing protease